MTRQVLPNGVLCLFLCAQRINRDFFKLFSIPKNCFGDVNIKPWENEFVNSEFFKIEIDLLESFQRDY